MTCFRRLPPGIPCPGHALAALCLALPGCCWLGEGVQAPADITRWQTTTPPTKLLREKASSYQVWIEEKHLLPEGVLRYQRRWDRPVDASYGDLADGPFHTGIYLASQSFRYAATRDPAALEQVKRALNGLRLLLEVTGVRGLLSRYVSPAGTIPTTEDMDGNPSSWRPSTALPRYQWRGDVSKDQYSGFIHGLGVALALVEDPGVRQTVADLSTAAADHLMLHHMQLVDADGKPTTHGNLAGQIFGIPIGVNALIALAIAKVAASSSGEERYRDFYRRLVAQDYYGSAYWSHFTVLGVSNRVNDNMSYLATMPLLLLERNDDLLEDLGDGESRTWGAVSQDHNAFFSFVHASRCKDARGRQEGIAAGREALLEFPEDKIEWPVDLTREGFDFPRNWLNTRKCVPRTTRGVPLYLRPRASSTWVSDPFRLVGNLTRQGQHETSGADYLLAYWMGRHFGYVSPEE